MKNSPILVTGSHRSGTTFTGKVLSLDRSVGLIYEPFNKSNFYGINRFNTQEWYQYVDNSNGNEYFSNFKETLNFNFSIDVDELKKRPLVKSLHIMKAYFEAQEYKILHKRPLVKDPIALFAAPWLAQNFRMNIVVLIRHPAAFASSVKALNWSHDFNSFINQPLLMNSHYLEPFREEVEDFAAKEYPIIEQAALLWRIFYSTVRHYQQEFPEWIYVKHESLSEDPLKEFKKLYERLYLNYTKEIEERIIQFTCDDHFSDPIAYDPSKLKRDSKKNIYLWKNRLKKDEILFIKNNVNDVSKYFYSENEW